jgi:hypothetical protein
VLEAKGIFRVLLAVRFLVVTMLLKGIKSEASVPCCLSALVLIMRSLTRAVVHVKRNSGRGH